MRDFLESMASVVIVCLGVGGFFAAVTFGIAGPLKLLGLL